MTRTSERTQSHDVGHTDARLVATKTNNNAAVEVSNRLAGRTHLPPGFDVEAWARDTCESSGVPFGVEDVLTLRRLAVLTRNPVTL